MLVALVGDGSVADGGNFLTKMFYLEIKTASNPAAEPPLHQRGLPCD
jgi:hypothetical protein